MSPAPFRDRLREAISVKGAPLCVGLDPDPKAIPSGLGQGVEGLRRHALAVIEATGPLAAAFKVNLAFFERLGQEGIDLLGEACQLARRHALLVVDAKRGDIGNTARAYAEAVYDVLGADACTVNAYLGRDSLEPFLEREGRCAFVVCRTSNPGAADLQDLLVGEEREPLYLHLARQVAAWDDRSTAGLVAGATWPEELAAVRRAALELPLLVPGVGAQGGDVKEAARAAGGPSGDAPFLVSSSRAIIHASSGEDFAEAAALAAAELHRQLREVVGQAVPQRG